MDGANLLPEIAITGKAKIFEQTHQVTDSAGKHAEAYVKVVNGKNIKYRSRVLPREGNLRKAQTQVSAEESLSVQNADYIKCSVSAYNPVGELSAGVQAEVFKGSLNGYSNRALAADGYVDATQSIQDQSCRSKGYASGQNILMGSWSSNAAGQSTETSAGIKSGSLKAFSNKAVATDEGAEVLMTSVDATGAEVKVDSRESNGLDWYQLRTSLFGTACNPAKYKGDLTASSGKDTTQIITSATGTDVSIEDTRVKNSAQQRVTLQSADGSFSGTAKSWDSGQIIQDMVNIAENGDTLKVGEGIYEGNNIIDKSLSIDGTGRGSTIVDGAGVNRVFTIGLKEHKISVALSDMTIYNGFADYGGGIKNAGTLNVDNCEISGNKANYGGGIFSAGKAEVSGSSVFGNIAHVKGGGIYNQGLMTVENCEIAGNSAGTVIDVSDIPTGGGISNTVGTLDIFNSRIYDNMVGKYSSCGDGGGIANFNGGTVTVTNCEVFGNKAIGVNHVINGKLITAVGGGIHNHESTMTVKDSKIFGNSADENGGGVYCGGANRQGLITLQNCEITGNTAGNLGGGVATFKIGSTTIKDCMISDNKAINGGGAANWNGGMLKIEGCTISENDAQIVGGGIYNSAKEGEEDTWQDAILTVTTSSIYSNTAQDGGGVYNYYGTLDCDPLQVYSNQPNQIVSVS